MISVRQLHTIATYEKLNHILRHGTSPVIAHNTAIVRWNDDSISVHLHGHRIVNVHEDGSVMIRSAGYQTTTTKQRLNQFIPNRFTVYQDKRVWYVLVHHNVILSSGTLSVKYERIPFVDGMTLFPDGTVSLPGSYVSHAEAS